MAAHRAPSRSVVLSPVVLTWKALSAWLRLTLASVRAVAVAVAALTWAALAVLLLLASLTTRAHGKRIRRNVAEIMIIPLAQRLGNERNVRTLPSVSTMMARLS